LSTLLRAEQAVVSERPAPIAADALPASGRFGGRTRRFGEWVLRAVALALVAWAGWRSVHPETGAGVDVVEPGALRSELARWTSGPAPAEVHARFAGVPDPTTRMWLGAIRRSGSRVTWDGVDAGALPATAIDVEPVADPRGVERLSVAAPAASEVVLGDRLGIVDSVRVPRELAVLRVPAPVTGLTASVGATVARAGAVDSIALRRIYVIAHAGWEAKFIVRALEEEGWLVDAHLLVAPKNDVVPVRPVVLDTANYAAVIAVDSAVGPEAQRVERFVAMGGGVVVAPAAVGALRAIAPGAAGATIRGATALADSAPLPGLTLAPVANVGAGVVTLASRGELTTVAARRVGNAGGRVVQVGYTDTWRWRMAAGDSGAVAYRRWWVGLVSAVAYAPTIPRLAPPTADPTPFVATLERLGRPVRTPPGGRAGGIVVPPVWVFAVMVSALLAEWASRRFRGAR
jgi:hypothetical protein